MTNISALRLDNLPRTIELVRNDGQFDGYPFGVPVCVILDQTKLPSEVAFVVTADWREVMNAIRTLVVRGAPAIGVAGACAVALRAAEFTWASADDMRDHVDDLYRTFVLDDADFDPDLYWTSLEFSAHMVANARPTAVSLSWAINNILAFAKSKLDAGLGPRALADQLFDYVKAMEADDEAINRAIGSHGAALLPEGACVLTHCNAGSLATVFFGTALGVIYTAAQTKGIARVFADETRPVDQGARLTAWELSQAGLPVTLICDSMAAWVMGQGGIDAVIVGADRIARNGDVANKIGTYGLAIAARYHNVPFYVAAPVSTIDSSAETGAAIPIEERASTEILPQPIEGVDVYNPSFDVTPAHLINSIITEKGCFAPTEVAHVFNETPL